MCVCAATRCDLPWQAQRPQQAQHVGCSPQTHANPQLPKKAGRLSAAINFKPLLPQSLLRSCHVQPGTAAAAGTLLLMPCPQSLPTPACTLQLRTANYGSIAAAGAAGAIAATHAPGQKQPCLRAAGQHSQQLPCCCCHCKHCCCGLLRTAPALLTQCLLASAQCLNPLHRT